MLDLKRYPLAQAIAAGLVLGSVACGGGDDGAGTRMDSAAGSVATATPGTGTAGVDSAMMNALASSMLSLLTTVDQAEIDAGQLAVARARGRRVKDFAQTMVEEHTEARRRLSEMGTARGWSMPGGSEASAGDMRSGSQAAAAPATSAGRAAGQGGTGGSAALAAVSIDSVTALLRTHQRTMGELRGVSGSAFDRAYIDSQIAAHQRVLGMLRASSATLQGELADYVRDMADKVQAHLADAQAIQRGLTGGR